MADKVSIIVVDDHPVFRQGLRQVIEAEPGFEIIGEAGDGKQALDLIRRLKPAVAVLDIFSGAHTSRRERTGGSHSSYHVSRGKHLQERG
jgi:DNA-binding NarL/FixJ family response regulator